MIRFLLFLVALCFLSTSLADEWGDEFVFLSSYHVSTKVNSRLLTTTIDMIFENTEGCSVLHGLSLQIPKDAVVTELVMDLSDGCKLGSGVKTLENAVEDFKDFYHEGKPAAILTAWDMSNFELQVSIPPNGTTAVSLKYQEVLVQKLDRVSFQVPMFPGVDVSDLVVDVSVEDSIGGLLDFQIDSEVKKDYQTVLDIGSAGMHYERRDVTEALTLPTLIQAHFEPGAPRENSLMMTDTDGDCFTHVFNPTQFLSDAGPMARKVVFVIDISGSMQGQKLRDAKASFSVMIDTLEEQDELILQTFASYGTEDKWGPNAATPENKAKAIEWVNALETKGSTNLHDAFKDAISRVVDAQETVVPIVVAMTDGQGSTPPDEMARSVRIANKDRRVKVFSIAFGSGADMDLLLGLALQNGGRAIRIYEGFGDTTNQMEQFYKQELGKILLSDISVSYDFGEVVVSDSTTSAIPVLAAGSEIVVRGRMDSSVASDNNSARSLKSVVSAKSAIGLQEWPIDNIVIPESGAGNCRQSYAQARIKELLEYRDANRTLGGELFSTAVSRSAFEIGATNLAGESFEEQAQKIALDAHLVWPGLTALLTVENANCQLNTSDVCFSGIASDSALDAEFDEENYGVSTSGNWGYYSGAKSNPGASRGWSFFFEASSLILIVLSSMMLVF